MLARVERIVLGAWDPKLGACGSVWDVVRDRRSTHRAEVVGGVLEEECGEVVRRFFATHRVLTPSRSGGAAAMSCFAWGCGGG